MSSPTYFAFQKKLSIKTGSFLMLEKRTKGKNLATMKLKVWITVVL